MQEGSNRRIIWVVIGFAALIALVFLGPRLAASYYYEKGRELYFQNDYEQAKKYFNRSITFNSKNPASHMYLGRIALGSATPDQKEYYSHADYAQAIPHYEKALELGIEKVNSGFYGHALEHLGLSYLHTKQYEKSREMYLKKIERFPNDFFEPPLTFTFWARYLVAEMDFDRFNNPREAYSILLPIAEQKNSDYKNLYLVYTLLSRLAVYFEDFDSAEKYAKSALENAGEGEGKARERQIAHGVLAQVYGLRKEFAKAEQEIKKANLLAGLPKHNDCVLASAYYRGGEYKKAYAVAKAASDRVPYIYSICLRTLGYTRLKEGGAAEAKKYFEEYLKITDAFEAKNIFTVRERENIRKELEKL